MVSFEMSTSLAASAMASASGSTAAPEVKSHRVDTGAMVTSNSPPDSALTCLAHSRISSVSSETVTGFPCAWLMFHTSLPSMVRDSSLS